MKELKYTTQFKKDLKRIQNDPKRIADVKKVLKILQKTGSVPKEYLPHKLESNFHYSVFNDSTGLRNAALYTCTISASMASAQISASAPAKIHQPTPVRY